jgi:putative ABC transport system permease protein
VLRALGMRSGAIFRLVVAESLLLSLLGIALGYALGVPLTLYLGHHPISLTSESVRASLEVFGLEPMLLFALSPSSLAGLPLVLVGVGLLASLLPALRAARGRPVDALRQT